MISLFGFDADLTDAPGELTMVEGILHCISLPAGDRLRRLGEHYDLVWATGWEDRANDHLPSLLGLPEELPVLRFGGRAVFGSAHWKLDAIDEYAGDRPLAWIDDNIDETCTRVGGAARGADAPGPDRIGPRARGGPRRRARSPGSRAASIRRRPAPIRG